MIVASSEPFILFLSKPSRLAFASSIMYAALRQDHCDADIAADHSFDTALYPKRAPNRINYFYKNGLIAANEEEARKVITAHSGKDFFSVKLLFPTTGKQLDGFGFPAGKLRFNETQNVVMFTKE